jgi:hypothetical protein
VLASTILVLAAACTSAPAPAADSLRAYAGSYGHGGEGSPDVVRFTVRDGELLMGPILWAGPMVLQRAARDSFVVAEHPRFGAVFRRDAAGCVVSAEVRGLSPAGEYRRLSAATPRPVELLVDGEPRAAARRLHALDPDGATRHAELGGRLLHRPSRVADAIAFLTELARLDSTTAALQATLGDALVLAGHRTEARLRYRRALALDARNEEAATALARLGETDRAGAADSGWTLPFPLDSLFVPPRAEEIDSVRARWRRRDLEPRDVEIVSTRRIDLDGVPAELRLVAHRVHGARHLGAVIVPLGAARGSLPILLEAKGVSPSFFPLVVPEGLTSPRVLGPDRGAVVYVVPGYRGERVVAGGDTLVSEGDRSDAWDGATDDLLALLRVAMRVVPEADTSRVCVFGRSRGGTVALLAGIRDPRIDCVVAWAAPTDWIGLMGFGGWTQRELVEEGLRRRAVPGETGGQFIDYFLRAAIDGRRGLAETRLHLIASSPLHVATTAGAVQAHWGIDDPVVAPINGRRFVAAYRPSGGAPPLDARFHPDAGHDQDRQLAPRQSREFLRRHILGHPPRRSAP